MMKMTRLSYKTSQRLDDIVITPLSEIHLKDAWLLWKTQYEEELSADHAMPDGWTTSREEIQSCLRKRMKSGYAMVAKNGNDMMGYMFFDVLPFHGEVTAFCPIIGHAAKQGYRKQVFEKLYQDLSRALVAKGILNHVITYFAHDDSLKETVFDLGFGLIVVDAFRGVDTIPSDDFNIDIVRADSSHVEVIEGLGEESRDYYLESPLFLTREKQSREYYDGLLENDSAIFLAFKNGEPVGIMQIRKNKELDAITLCDMKTSLIDRTGAYIKPKFRRQGIGSALLSNCVQWCRNHGTPRIHVDFESANLSGRSFWLKYFTAAMHSVRRTIFPDAFRAQEK
jgi:GNAT superfamily N-acetyltransferase